MRTDVSRWLARRTYSAADYAGILDEYETARRASPATRTPLDLST